MILRILMTAFWAACVIPGLAAPAFEEDFERIPVGAFEDGANGWSLMQNTKTSAWLQDVPDRGRALRILDDHSAQTDATCRLRHTFEVGWGRSTVCLKMMMQQGQAERASQDMGLHLFCEGTLILDLFFSGGELRTWQGPAWESLQPPVKWQAGRWYDIELDIDSPAGTATVSVDGESHGTVDLRGKAGGLSMIELTCQRYAMGELWVDDIRVEHILPPELAAQPGREWRQASADERQEDWFADEGSVIRDGVLRSQGRGFASMRRLVRLEMTRFLPVLRMKVEPKGHATCTVYLRTVEATPRAAVLESRSGHVGLREYDVFALTGWQGTELCDVLVSAHEGEGLGISGLRVDNGTPADYLQQAGYAQRFIKPSTRANALPGPVGLKIVGQPNARVPVTFGVPFKAGVLSDPAPLRLRGEGGAALPLQARPLSLWPDGTVRWLLVDTTADSPVSGRLDVELVDSGKRARPQAMARSEGGQIRVRLAQGTLTIPTGSYGPITGLAGGLDGTWQFVARVGERTYRSSRAAPDGFASYEAHIEENGPLRTTVCMRGLLASGPLALGTYELRLTAYRDVPWVELAPTFTLTTQEPEVQLQELSLILGGTFAPGSVAVGGDEPLHVHRQAGSALSLLQDQRERYSIAVDGEQRAGGKHAMGWIDTGSCLVAVRRFWQQFPKRLALSDDQLRVELWASSVKPRRFGRGAAKTHNILLAFYDAPLSAEQAVRTATAFEHPAVIYPGAEVYRASGALGPVVLPSAENAAMDAVYEYALNRRIQERERRASTSYGMVHFGDINHINSEIDAHKAFFMQWARTGDRKWLDFGLDWALHGQDIDVCHYSPNPREIGIHHSHYPSDHNNGGLTLTHTWIEGQLFRYYLTGDRRSLMAADLAGRAFSTGLLTSGQMFDGGRKGNGIGSRAYGRACWALCELYRATGNPRYTWAMKRLLGYLTGSLRQDGAVPASHNGAGAWSVSDECPHMAAICAVGIARYTELTGDRSFLPALERIARWQMSRGAMPEKLGIMYHNYPGGEVIHFVDACADMLEAWGYLYEVTRKPIYRDFAEMVFDTALDMNARWRSDWTMSVANMLLYLARREGWQSRPEYAPLSTLDGPPTTAWLRECQNPDGGFGLTPDLLSDMDSTYRAVHALALLGAQPKRKQACIDWVGTCHNEDGGFAGEPGWHSNAAWTWFALKTLKALDTPIPDADKTVQWLTSLGNEDGGNGSSPVTGKMAYHPSWPSSAEYTSYKAQALSILAQEPPNGEAMAEFLRGLQVEGKGFKHRGGEANSGYTLDALEGLGALDAGPKDAEGCADWLTSLRREDGGYGPEGVSHSTLRHTAQCVLGLAALGHKLEPGDAQATRGYILACQDAGGGFAYRPGHTPTVLATWYALRAMRAVP